MRYRSDFTSLMTYEEGGKISDRLIQAAIRELGDGAELVGGISEMENPSSKCQLFMIDGVPFMVLCRMGGFAENSPVYLEHIAGRKR